MTTYVQETASRLIGKFPNELFYSSVPAQVPYTMADSTITTGYIPVSVGSAQLGRAWELIDNLEEGMSRQAKGLLSIIQQTISVCQQIRLDHNYIPRLQAHRAEDGSVLFEWVFPYYRIGFTIEPNPQESGWFLVSNRNLGSINASGFITGIDLDRLVLWLLEFIVAHS